MTGTFSIEYKITGNTTVSEITINNLTVNVLPTYSPWIKKLKSA